MRKDASYKEKFILLQPWVGAVVSSVKKDLKNDHLKRDAQFCKRFLSGKNLNKLTDNDLIHAYTTAINESENGEVIAEFIANRWLLKHGDVYHFFEQQLQAIDPNFSDLEQLSLDDSNKLAAAAIAEFGPIKSYLFAIFNSVVFHESTFQNLAKAAEKVHSHEEQTQLEINQKATLDQIKVGYEQQIARLTDKYEKKLTGLQKKYVQDTETLKKQLAQLQRKLAPAAAN